MSIFQTLATVRKLFAQSGIRALFRGLYVESENRIRATVWFATLVYIGSPLTLIDQPNQLVPYSVSIGLGLIFFAVIEWALSRHFHEEYTTYAITGNRFSQSRILLHYALFVRRLEESQLSSDDLRKVVKWFETAEPPTKQEFFLRHPLVTPILALLGVLSAETLKSTEAWKHGQGIYWVIMIVALLFIASGVFGFFRRGRDSEARLSQFLSWYLASKEVP